ncbi:hydroxyethylthiazole kinase [Dyadobacter sediminis]|uniref:Hydroxyethylthiazole kinase n=1 Tax=Dyadobacter sediminis TaxID=1493691 RepID=A0A5R9KA28_9BACT|nr:hydroxyethylthiazole kinase [Dyadobacter sediminis]TLU91683.1 hydroxyethylthiazole kinase [Dyadobacter sediminis]GGC01241.1 hydroxyethylthiazole kinase [Dyadobacter sediminis]
MEFNLANNLHSLRASAPLVHNITNYVVMNFTANALLAIGASPVMSHAAEEAEDMVSIAGALVVNIGTLSPEWVKGMKLAMRKAAQTGRPIILDPVGAGATPYRNAVLTELLETAAPTIIRGNASEIMALAGTNIQTKGVDSTASSAESMEAAKALSLKYGSVISVSGETDVIVSGTQAAFVSGGVPLMTKITGMGCTASALAGAFAAVSSDPFHAAVSAAAAMSVCGELAYRSAKLPGSFQIAFLDALADISPAHLAELSKVKFTSL